MQVTRSFWGLAVAAASALPALTMAGEPSTADEVIARYIEAIGGRSRLDAIKTVRKTGTMVVGGGMLSAPFTAEIKRPHFYRMDFKVQDMTGTQAYDGTGGWSVKPFMGQTEPERMSDDELQRVEDRGDIDGPLVDYRKKGNDVELIGFEDVDGVQAYKLRVARKNGDVEYYFIDAEAFLPIRLSGTTQTPSGEAEYSTTLGDYKEVGGVLMPHSITQEAGGMGGNAMTFDKIEVNIDLPDSRFLMPKSDQQKAGAPRDDGD